MTNNSKIVKLEGLSEILFEKSSIEKSIRISFRPPSYIRVAVPKGVTFSAAQKFNTKNFFLIFFIRLEYNGIF